MSEYQKLAQDIEAIQIERRIRYIEAQIRFGLETGSKWQRIGDGFALYAGPGSPVNRVMGLGLKQAVNTSDIDLAEEFYSRLNEPIRIDLCPMAHESTLTQLGRRGYAPDRFDEILYTATPEEIDASPDLQVDLVPMNETNREIWIEVIARSFMDISGNYEDNYLLSRKITIPTSFSSNYTGTLVFLDGKAVAAAGIFMLNYAAEMAPDGTIPDYRRRGIQTALMKYRVKYAISQGCKLIVTACAPGVETRSNAERIGFKLAYTKPVMIKSK